MEDNLITNIEKQVDKLLGDAPDFVKAYVRLYIFCIFTGDKSTEIEFMGAKILIPEKCYEALKAKDDLTPETYIGFVFSHISACLIRRVFEQLTLPNLENVLENFNIPEGYLVN